MKLCDLQTGMSSIQKETKRLQDQWEQTKQHWDDQASHEFEQKYLAPLMPQLRQTFAKLHEIAEVFDKVQKDCCDE